MFLSCGTAQCHRGPTSAVDNQNRSTKELKEKLRSFVAAVSLSSTSTITQSKALSLDVAFFLIHQILFCTYSGTLNGCVTYLYNSRPCYVRCVYDNDVRHLSLLFFGPRPRGSGGLLSTANCLTEDG